MSTPPNPRHPITSVHIIFKTHLDLGFTDFARLVTRRYFEHYIPSAMRVARELREKGSAARLVWTTGSWLIHEFLEQASPPSRRTMERAIEAGDIIWHGLPFTTHSELMDASLFRFGLSLSRDLDRRFGKKTIAAKMTDVPGHTRAIVPLLAEAGIRFLHIGVNPASTPPDVPDIFRWRHDDGSEVLVMYDTSGYGQTHRLPVIGAALTFAHTGDNCGPQAGGEIERIFRDVQRQFPGAAVAASSLDAFAATLLVARTRFPIVTAEIGDTWIHGAGTDPMKVGRFRELCRLRAEWLDLGIVDGNEEWFRRFSTHLLCIPEHTWGMDEKTFLDDYSRYDRQCLKALRKTGKCRVFESSWREQRGYIDKALSAIKPASLSNAARTRIAALKPAVPSKARFHEVHDPKRRMALKHFDACFSPADGCISYLRHRESGRIWCAGKPSLFAITYQLFDHRDYQRFGRQYLRNWPHAWDWAIKDFTKPGIENLRCSARSWTPEHTRFFQRVDHRGTTILAEMRMPEFPVRRYGCPKTLMLEMAFPHDQPAIVLRLQWFGKRACRLPEATWFSFRPTVRKSGSWLMDKMGSLISPRDVLPDGNRRLHAVGRGVTYRDIANSCAITTLDAPLVAPGKPSLLDFNNRLSSVAGGMHFCLHNNAWGTNFPMWYEDDAAFRFRMEFR